MPRAEPTGLLAVDERSIDDLRLRGQRSAEIRPWASSDKGDDDCKRGRGWTRRLCLWTGAACVVAISAACAPFGAGTDGKSFDFPHDANEPETLDPVGDASLIRKVLGLKPEDAERDGVFHLLIVGKGHPSDPRGTDGGDSGDEAAPGHGCTTTHRDTGEQVPCLSAHADAVSVLSMKLRHTADGSPKLVMQSFVRDQGGELGDSPLPAQCMPAYNALGPGARMVPGKLSEVLYLEQRRGLIPCVEAMLTERVADLDEATEQWLAPGGKVKMHGYVELSPPDVSALMRNLVDGLLAPGLARLPSGELWSHADSLWSELETALHRQDAGQVCAAVASFVDAAGPRARARMAQLTGEPGWVPEPVSEVHGEGGTTRSGMGRVAGQGILQGTGQGPDLCASPFFQHLAFAMLTERGVLASEGFGNANQVHGFASRFPTRTWSWLAERKTNWDLSGLPEVAPPDPALHARALLFLKQIMILAGEAEAMLPLVWHLMGDLPGDVGGPRCIPEWLRFRGSAELNDLVSGPESGLPCLTDLLGVDGVKGVNESVWAWGYGYHRAYMLTELLQVLLGVVGRLLHETDTVDVRAAGVPVLATWLIEEVFLAVPSKSFAIDIIDRVWRLPSDDRNLPGPHAWAGGCWRDGMPAVENILWGPRDGGRWLRIHDDPSASGTSSRDQSWRGSEQHTITATQMYAPERTVFFSHAAGGHAFAGPWIRGSASGLSTASVPAAVPSSCGLPDGHFVTQGRQGR